MARPRQDTIKVPTRRRLLEAAEACFGRDGFAEATLADIASKAGIRRASLLYHFSSKEGLYQAVLERLFQALGEALVLSFDGASEFEVRLMAVTQAFLDFLEQRPAFSALVVRDIMDDRGQTREQLFALLDPVVSLVEDWVAREGDGVVVPGLDVRAALLLICSDALLRHGSGSLGRRLWGQDHRALEMSRRLFFAR